MKGLPNKQHPGPTFLFLICLQPDGGVKEGQTFTVPVVMPSAPLGEATPLMAKNGSNNYYDTTVPRGQWKDGLCDVCIVGPCHPALWNALCCPQILMAQVLTRMNLSWLGDTTPNASQTFRNVILVLLCYWILGSLLAPPTPDVEVVGDDMAPEWVARAVQVPVWQALVYRLLNMAFGLYSLIVLMRL